MERIYLDNAATTAIDPEVVEAMLPYLTEKFGNPSSVHAYGRETKKAVETARKTVAGLLKVKPGEIFFTSCGTESTNTAIWAALKDLGCTRIISSPIEHHATMYAVREFGKLFEVKIEMVNLLPDGHVDLEHLEALLANGQGEKTLVTLMHANNEIGNLLDIERVGDLCEDYQAIFHCDTVQTVGHYDLDFSKIKVHFASATSHKFHGPKGVGILFVRGNLKIHPLLQGGGQERSMRSGTENIYGIVGFAKALEIAMQRLEEDKAYIQSLKDYMIEQLEEKIPGVRFNGDYKGKSLYTVLNTAFPMSEKSEMILFHLDMAGICVSAGSACNSGASKGSHVLEALDMYPNTMAIRFSFSKFNTPQEIDRTIQKIVNVL